ncbi:acidic mammalian chitinase-like [Eurosta solidaginis]|uniref:acidic mammalian chitinase-like n=1 Tax=Eurosta solidaginis TaxID=178769 RepID=UPI0035309614
MHHSMRGQAMKSRRVNNLIWMPSLNIGLNKVRHVKSSKYLERQWIGFENPRSIGLTAQYITNKNLGGIMLWSLESEDYRGEKYPLLQTINRVLFDGHTATGIEQSLLNSVAESIQRPVLPFLAGFNKQTFVLSARGNADCVNRENGYLRDAQDCGKFYYCVQGMAHLFSCPNDLKFDMRTKSCNYQDLVEF